MKLLLTLLMLGTLAVGCSDRVDDNDSVGTALNKTGRNIKEGACEMVNGKLECLDEKLENTGKNIKDEVKDMSE